MSRRSLVTPYMHWWDLSQILEPGDLIEFKRGENCSGSGGALYKHWAVYIGVNSEGDHVVIHFSNEATGPVAQGNFVEILGDVKVKRDYLKDVARGCMCRKNNGCDENDVPYSPQDIVRRAKDRIGETGYNLATNNCEHFANKCRYGKHRSEQVTKVTKTAVEVGTAVVVGAAIGLGIAYFTGLFDGPAESAEARRERERNEQRAMRARGLPQ